MFSLPFSSSPLFPLLIRTDTMLRGKVISGLQENCLPERERFLLDLDVAGEVVKHPFEKVLFNIKY